MEADRNPAEVKINVGHHFAGLHGNGVEAEAVVVAGEQVARKAAQLNAGNVVNVHLAKAGIYVLNVKKDGKTVRTVKLIRK